MLGDRSSVDGTRHSKGTASRQILDHVRDTHPLVVDLNCEIRSAGGWKKGAIGHSEHGVRYLIHGSQRAGCRMQVINRRRVIDRVHREEERHGARDIVECRIVIDDRDITRTRVVGLADDVIHASIFNSHADRCYVVSVR